MLARARKFFLPFCQSLIYHQSYSPFIISTDFNGAADDFTRDSWTCR